MESRSSLDGKKELQIEYLSAAEGEDVLRSGPTGECAPLESFTIKLSFKDPASNHDASSAQDVFVIWHANGTKFRQEVQIVIGSEIRVILDCTGRLTADSKFDDFADYFKDTSQYAYEIFGDDDFIVELKQHQDEYMARSIVQDVLTYLFACPSGTLLDDELARTHDPQLFCIHGGYSPQEMKDRRDTSCDKPYIVFDKTLDVHDARFTELWKLKMLRYYHL